MDVSSLSFPAMPHICNALKQASGPKLKEKEEKKAPIYLFIKFK